MKTIGLLGGMSWESTRDYYTAINQGVKERLGGLHSAQLVLYSVDFNPIEKLQHQGDWAGTAEILCQAARNIEAAGAEFLLICTNTMHKVAPEIEAAIQIPLVHLADATNNVAIASSLFFIVDLEEEGVLILPIPIWLLVAQAIQLIFSNVFLMLWSCIVIRLPMAGLCMPKLKLMIRSL